MAKAWASHGARKTGPSASRGMPGTASAACRAVCRATAKGSSGMLEIGLEGIDGNPDRRICIRAPQFARIEAHRVKPLRLFAFAGHEGVGKHVRAVNALDYADVPA